MYLTQQQSSDTTHHGTGEVITSGNKYIARTSIMFKHVENISDISRSFEQDPKWQVRQLSFCLLFFFFEQWWSVFPWLLPFFSSHSGNFFFLFLFVVYASCVLKLWWFVRWEWYKKIYQCLPGSAGVDGHVTKKSFEHLSNYFNSLLLCCGVACCVPDTPGHAISAQPIPSWHWPCFGERWCAVCCVFSFDWLQRCMLSFARYEGGGRQRVEREGGREKRRVKQRVGMRKEGMMRK